ncbi:MAG: VIT family protein [Lactobacillales bacterium]|jgi:VIT1/CCC1 family predicted Fe2+/Mn2+ transporter|nr:VIT family protein [Lactobacillales bacterium]
MTDNSNLGNKLNVLRAGVLGANDGIVSVAGVVIGVASATGNEKTILIAGISALLAGAFSMAGGEYVSVSTQRDTEQASIHEAEKLLTDCKECEIASLAKRFISNGVDPVTAEKVASEEIENNGVAVVAHEKYNLEVGEYTSPWYAAIASFVSFTIGAILPLFAVIIAPKVLCITLTAIAVVIALIITGSVSAWIGGADPKRAAWRNVTVGVATMIVTYLIGTIFNSGFQL